MRVKPVIEAPVMDDGWSLYLVIEDKFGHEIARNHWASGHDKETTQLLAEGLDKLGIREVMRINSCNRPCDGQLREALQEALKAVR